MSQKRRTYTADFKFEAVMELLRGHKPVAQICRERGIRDNLLYKWRDAFVQRAPRVFETTDRHDEAQAVRIAELKEEHVAYAEYDDFDDAPCQLKHWLEVEYLHERIHSALDYQTPAEFEVACQPPLPRTA